MPTYLLKEKSLVPNMAAVGPNNRGKKLYFKIVLHLLTA